MVNGYSLDISKLRYSRVLEDFSSSLHPEVIAKAEAYKHPRDKLRSLTAAILLRWAIHRDFGLYYSGPFPCSKHGKPYLPDTGIEFNVSHGRNRIAVATAGHPVGIDVEYRRTNKLHVAKRFFSEPEIASLKHHGDPDAHFTTLWCIKESFLKYTGKGLTRPLSTFAVEQNNERYAISENGDTKADICIQFMYDKPDYFYAICHDSSEAFSRIQPIAYDVLLNYQEKTS